jgi:mono/diheme cytochrome c family protein
MKRIQLEIVLGTVFVFLSAAILIAFGFREQDRLAESEETQRAELIEFGAGIYEQNCTRCHGSHGQGIVGLAPCLRCEELFTTRLEEVGWEGSLEDYVVSVVTIGRQVSTRPALYPGGGTPAMPTWSEQFGGPLRQDQVRAVAAFVVNFETWALEPDLVPTPVGLVVDPTDPTSLGRVVFIEAGCVACHTVSGVSSATIGPVLDGLASRAGDTVAGLSAEDYIRESILNPNAYIVDGFTEGIMVQTFGDSIAPEDL